MKKVLIINASARTTTSQSRKLSHVFVDHWKELYPNATIRFRELGNTDVPHVYEDWIIAASRPEALRTEEDREILKLSNLYISELREADLIVLSTPMYNWSIPSSLKAYIDQVLRVNETFKVDPGNARHPYVGLLENKSLLLLLSRGGQGYEKGEANEHMDFQTAYLKTIFTTMGIHAIQVIALNGTSIDPERLVTAIETAQEEIRQSIDQEQVRA